MINKQLAGPITLVNEYTFLVPFASREEVKEVCKLGNFDVSMKDDPYDLKIAQWLAELGANGKASGEGSGCLYGTSRCMGGLAGGELVTLS